MKSNPPIALGQTNYNGHSAHRPGAKGLSSVLMLVLSQISHVAASPIRKYLERVKEDAPEAEDPSMWLYLLIAAVLVLLGGAFAGLTIALMGQDGVYLQVIATSGDGKEQKHAQRVYRLLQKGKHWVLVTLLLSNVIVNETLPIVLDRSLGGGWPAVLGSTVLIVIFGEVIPQSVCVRYGLSIGAYMAPFVLGLMWILAPIAWPTAKLLDRLLGEDHGTVYKKSGLKTLVTLHKTLGTSPTDRLNQDEVTIISAVLDLKDKAVGDIMTPMEDVFTMSADTVLDEDTMNIILSAGYSRIPIYEPGNNQNFVGMLLVKILITYDPEDCKKVSEFALATLPETRPETSCLDIVNFFQEGKSHMVLVSDCPGENYGAIGVVTLEDVIEELIGEEIIDESDVYIDVHKAIRRMAPAPKARAHKGSIDNSDKADLFVVDNRPNDLTEAQGLPLAKRLTNGGGRSNSPATFATSPKTTFLRRTSDGGAGNTIQVRGNVNDMREHLKHLGPSNLASRPKQTRYNTVKIKPGHPPNRSDSRADSSAVYHDSIVDEPYTDEPAPQGGEGEGLLRSAGLDASDGVAALYQGYGSFNPPQPPTKDSEGQLDGPPKQSVLSTTGASRESNSPSYRAFLRHNSNDSERSSDTLGSLHSSNNSPTRRRHGAARSGSITENVIEAGGVRKVILETSQSSGDERHNNIRIENDPSRRSPPEYTVHDGPTDAHESQGGQPSPEGEQVKKKRRRQRKKKVTKTGGEDSSAAGGSGL